MEFDGLLQVGSDILNDVNEAVVKGDFKNLGSNIKSRVDRASEEIRKKQVDDARRRFEAQNKVRVTPPPIFRSPKPQSYYFGYGKAPKRGRARTVAGGILAAVFGVSTITSIFEVAGLVTGGGVSAGSIEYLLMSLLLTLVSLWIMVDGMGQKKLYTLYYRIGQAIGGAEFIPIETLRQRVGVDSKDLCKSLQKMMDERILPQARFDTARSTLILTDAAYDQYLIAEQSRMEREQQRLSYVSDDTDFDGLSEEVVSFIKTGEDYLRRFREINDRIPYTDGMTEKLDRLEANISKIFDHVKKDPSKATTLRRFMDYYLPTTDKLLNAYVELGPDYGGAENIAATKQEISDALDVINDAYDNLFNQMLQTVAWDISSDISVMKTMMEMDGLVK